MSESDEGNRMKGCCVVYVRDECVERFKSVVPSYDIIITVSPEQAGLHLSIQLGSFKQAQVDNCQGWREMICHHDSLQLTVLLTIEI